MKLPQNVLDLITAYKKGEAKSTPLGPITFTTPQLTTLALVALGYQYKEIASATGKSIQTIEKHRQALGHKIGARSQMDLAHYAIKHGLIILDK